MACRPPLSILAASRVPAHLPRGGLDQSLLAEPEGRTPQPRQTFDVALAGLVEHAHALAPGDDQRAFRLQELQVGERMQVVCHVPAGRRCANAIHGITLLARGARGAHVSRKSGSVL